VRYTILVLLNLPVILLALVNIVTQYKLKKVTRARFRHQVTLWLIVLIVLIISFPIYNLLTGHSLLDSSELSLFDIFQTTAIVVLFYIINNQRQKIERNEKVIRELHQEISIRLSKK
jgi:hypothetical protein